jgi:hypothetical protein
MLSALAILIVSTIATSCKKETVTVTTTDTIVKCLPRIEGLWSGTYSVTGQPGLGNQTLNLIIKTDGTMVNDSKAGGVQHLAIGTWTLTGDTAFVTTATAVYGAASNIGISQTHRAIYNKTTGTLTLGTWTNNSGPVSGGAFTLTKVN